MQSSAESAVSCASKSRGVPPHFVVAIPTNNSFTSQWHKWVYKKVSKHFKRNKERIPDTVQYVFHRLLSKDAVGRWFFKHLTHELVDRTEAERILGGVKLTFVSQVTPVLGRRNDDNSLWCVKDLLTYAKFDYERYYYSIQKHTVDSSKVLRLLGYGSMNDTGQWVCNPSDVAVLESMYRQGRLRPAELTEHACTERYDAIPSAVPHDGFCLHDECKDRTSHHTVSMGFCNRHSKHRICIENGCGRKHFSRGYCNAHYSKFKSDKCLACDHGRKLLADRGLSLTHRWDSPESVSSALKLRWNDSQLKDFLRDWRRQNMVKSTPRHILRPVAGQGIDAGLLRYMEMIIDNAVVNDFKTITRSDDIESMVFNNGQSPELPNTETTGWESSKTEGNDVPERVVCDTTALASFRDFENRYDARRLASDSGLDADELRAVANIDIAEQSIREFADESGRSVQQIHKIRNAALAKMRALDEDDCLSDREIAVVAKKVCDRYEVSFSEMMGPAVIGRPVLARTDFFSGLHSAGMPATTISSRFSTSVERVIAAINRAARRAPAAVETSLSLSLSAE